MKRLLIVGFILIATIAAVVTWRIYLAHSSMCGPTESDRQSTCGSNNHVISAEGSSLAGKESAIALACERTNSAGVSMATVGTPTGLLNRGTDLTEANKENLDLGGISKDKALEIAREAIGNVKYAKALPIVVKDLDGEYCVRFPVDKTVPAGTRYRGSDYAAEVRIEKRTGKVFQVRLGE